MTDHTSTTNFQQATTKRNTGKPPREKTFWKRVRKGTPQGCWEWQGGKTQDGYGKAGYKNKNVLAHRLAWELTNGPIPKGMHVLHRCDNPPCCNPAHLFLGTHSDNMRDMFGKGRKSGQGTKNNRAKLTDAQVVTIRARFAAGHASIVELAKEYHVNSVTIRSLIKRQTWAHIP